MTLIQIQNLQFSYKHKPVLKSVTFDIEEGSFVGIVGPNGSGKTTLLKLIQRLFTPQKGNILLNGQDIREFSSRVIAKEIAGVWQRPMIAFPFTAKQFVMLGRTPHLNFLRQETTSDDKVVEESLRLTNCLDFVDRSVLEISAGEFQRVCIAAALAQQPEILLLDEPTSFLDLLQRGRLSRLLFQLQKRGITVICASHDLAFLKEHAQKILLLVDGVQVEFGPYEQVLSQKRLAEIFEFHSPEILYAR